MFYFHVFELLSFQSAVLPAFAVLSYFCLDNKNNTQGALPEPGMKQNVSPCSLVELILFEFLSKVEDTLEGHHKLAIPAYSRE